MLTIPKTKPMDGMTFHTAVKQVVPALHTIEISDTEIVLTRLSAEFDASEVALIQQVLDAHDALAIQAAREAIDLKIAEEKAKDPKNLSNVERIARLEIVLGIDQPT